MRFIEDQNKAGRVLAQCVGDRVPDRVGALVTTLDEMTILAKFLSVEEIQAPWLELRLIECVLYRDDVRHADYAGCRQYLSSRLLVKFWLVAQPQEADIVPARELSVALDDLLDQGSDHERLA